ncbi:calcium homeostasis endoplasmic reticulum protein isoform X1 [Stigmatopora argus]
METPTPPEDQELRNVIDKLAQFVARNGPEFEKMTMDKQKDNPKFSFLFGGDYFSYYKCKLTLAQQQHPPTRDGEEFKSQELYNPGALDVGDIPPPPTASAAAPSSASTPGMDDVIQQSLWNLQHQEQHLHTLRQEQVSAAIAAAAERQLEKLMSETNLDVNEMDNLLQPIIEMCTKDAISAGKNWMFNNAKTPQHCELMTSHLRNRITAEEAHFELRLHLIYLTNDVLHHCQRKQQKDLLAALQKVVVPIYCTSFLAVEEEKQQKITRLLQLWEKNGYFDEETIQQLQNPALGLGQYQASLITEYAGVVQPIQMAFQQQVQVLKTQHDEFVASLKKQPPSTSKAEKPTSAASSATPTGEAKTPASSGPPGDFDEAPSRGQDSGSSGNSGGASELPPKPAWYDSQRMGPWNPNQPPPFDPNQPPPPCPPWNSHEGMWNEQRESGSWSGGPSREGGPWSGPEQGPPSWNSYDQQPPWGNQQEQPPWGQREPPFPPRMQRPPHFRGPYPPHQQPPPFNQPPPPPHSFGRFPSRFMQDDFPPRHHYERSPFTPHRFDYSQGDFPRDMPGPPPPPPHHSNPRHPPSGMGGDHPPWGGSQHPDYGPPPPPPPPPPHGFNGHSPHVRHRQPPVPVQDDPSLVPNVPYFDLPAGLMAPLVKLEDYDYKALDPKDIRLPPPMPPSERLLAAVEAFYSPPSHDRPRNSEGWEQNGLYEFFRAKMRARRKKGQDKRNSSGRSGSRSRSRSGSRGRSSSPSSSRSSKSRSRSRSRSGSRSSRSRSRSRSYSHSRSRSGSASSRSRSRSRSHSRSPSRRRRGHRSRSDSPPSTSSADAASSKGPPDSRLGEENKGHQLLMKMGWSGSGGLGAKEQGIQDPIKGGDIRDKWDQYKGVGVCLDDPYENYRRNKSFNFVARMKAREEVNREPQEAPPAE